MDSLTLIVARRQEIQIERRTLAQKDELLARELDELGVAEKVLARLATREAPDVALIAGSTGKAFRSDDAPTEVSDEHGLSKAKPVGAPTVPQMILKVLQAASGLGRVGMEPRHIKAQIAQHWWPDVTTETVNSIVWRMWKRGQLVKDGSAYRLPPTEPDLGISLPPLPSVSLDVKMNEAANNGPEGELSAASDQDVFA